MMPRMLFTLVLTLAAGLVSACTKDSGDGSSQGAASPATSHELANGLTYVDDPSLVCMVNNTYMGKAQIPVEVQGKTYFGCCPMCKERLANEPDTRTAVDPVTGETVDKATAVIAKDADGNVRYFANQANLRGYGVAP
jgi:YHS domain-containing protein